MRQISFNECFSGNALAKLGPTRGTFHFWNRVGVSFTHQKLGELKDPVYGHSCDSYADHRGHF